MRGVEMKIEEARKAATEFLRDTLQKGGAIVKMGKTPEGWEVQVEVIEPSEFIKALGIPTVVRERNLYQIALNQNLEVVSYERLGQQVAAKRTA
jgi:hypothetical protein